MDIIERNEAFKYVENKLSFHCVRGIVRIDDILHLAEWDDRFHLPTNATQLRILKQINTQDRGPSIRDGWTIVTPKDHYYIKTPNLHAYCDHPDLEGLIAREVETCELLKLHPHPNISPYFGCTAVRGRVAGLCFRKHHQTLLERVNPRGLNKDMFLGSEDRLLSVGDALRQATDQLLGAIKHLHSLGMIHNDITPANIMVEEDGTLVLIDFDSCRLEGEALDNTKRTYGWHDPKEMTAKAENDLDAFSELQTWLFGTSADSYRFS